MPWRRQSLASLHGGICERRGLPTELKQLSPRSPYAYHACIIVPQPRVLRVIGGLGIQRVWRKEWGTASVAAPGGRVGKKWLDYTSASK